MIDGCDIAQSDLKSTEIKGYDLISVRDFFNIYIPPVKGGKILFRGQSTDKPLLPKIARLAKEYKFPDAVEKENRLLDSFKRVSIPYLQFPYPNNDWDWLSIARHYGLPTRLLDWTTNAFIALWFAVNDEKGKKTDSGVLWVLRADSDDLKSPDDKKSPFDIERTYIFQPSHLNRRISAQSGWFSIHKYIEGKNKFIPLENNKSYRKKLTKHIIPYEFFPIIRKELLQMGLNKLSIYQDLGGLCDYLTEELVSDTSKIKSEDTC